MATRETIWNLPHIEVIDDLGSVVETRPAAVLTGNRAWNAVGSLLNLPIVVQAEPRTAEQGFLNSLADGLPEHVEVVYGIGGGLAADSAKYVAHKTGKPAVIIPTALSVDGFFTSLVAVRKDGSVAYETTGPAEKVYVDFDVVSSAPEHIRGTGIVEILSMTTGLLDWKYAADRRKNAPHERYQLWAAQVAASIAQQAYKIADAVGRGSPDALRKPRQAGQQLVGENAEFAGKTLADPLHMRGAGHDQTEPALGPIGEPFELVVGERAVRMALRVGERRKHEAVRHRAPASERKRFEQLRHEHFHQTETATILSGAGQMSVCGSGRTERGIKAQL